MPSAIRKLVGSSMMPTVLDRTKTSEVSVLSRSACARHTWAGPRSIYLHNRRCASMAIKLRIDRSDREGPA